MAKFRRPTATQTKDAAQGSALAISLPSQPSLVINVNEPDASFSPFISDGSVSLRADGEKVQIKILRYWFGQIIYLATIYAFLACFRYWPVCFSA